MTGIAAKPKTIRRKRDEAAMDIIARADELSGICKLLGVHTNRAEEDLEQIRELARGINTL